MPSSERKRVLILEDELPVALSLKSIVHDYGCEVIGPASSCPSAIDLLEANPVDAALLDLSVGEEACDQLASELGSRGIPWALLTELHVSKLRPRFKNGHFIASLCVPSEVHLMLMRLLEAQAVKARQRGRAAP